MDIIKMQSLPVDFKCKHNLTGGGKISSSQSAFLLFYKRLHALKNVVCRAAIFVCLIGLSFACQKAELIPSDMERDTRGSEATTEEAKDSTKVTPNITVDDDWEGIIDMGFGFGGEEQKGGNL